MRDVNKTVGRLLGYLLVAVLAVGGVKIIFGMVLEIVEKAARIW